MKKEGVLYGIIGLLAGVVIAGFAAGQAVNNNNTGMMRMMGMETAQQAEPAEDHGSMSMDDMSRELENLSGDAYDKAFIEMMIAHHKGAVDMARLSDARAKHDEIKQLSANIIAAQEKEISQMYDWQALWNYPPNESQQMMHGNH